MSHHSAQTSGIHHQSDVIIDALPYFDSGYDEPGVREAALSLVEEETKRYKPSKNYLEHLPSVTATGWETEALTAGLERLSNQQPLELLSMRRYELPPPATGRRNDLSAWSEAVDNSMAQLEHQLTRLVNLQLLQLYGSEAWRLHNEELSALVDLGNNRLQSLRKLIQEVNWARKSQQMEAGSKIEGLERRWFQLVRNNYALEGVCNQLEADIDVLKSAEKELETELSNNEEVDNESGVHTNVTLNGK